MTERTRALNKKALSALTAKSTEIGRINRKIEKSVSGIVTGSNGATGRAISLAKQREKILVARTARKKISA